MIISEEKLTIYYSIRWKQVAIVQTIIIINSKVIDIIRQILDLDLVWHTKAKSGEKLVCYNIIDLYSSNLISNAKA